MLVGMDCLFCDGQVTSLPTHGYDGEILDCPKDGQHKIVRGMRHRLEGMNLHGRQSALAEAKARVKPGELPELFGR